VIVERASDYSEPEDRNEQQDEKEDENEALSPHERCNKRPESETPTANQGDGAENCDVVLVDTVSSTKDGRLNDCIKPDKE
jgi:hypothetical protein